MTLLTSIAVAMWYIAAMLLENGGQGYLAVHISIMVAPTLHTSALRPCPTCLIISGAIHGIEPRIVGTLSSKLCNTRLVVRSQALDQRCNVGKEVVGAVSVVAIEQQAN